MLGRPALRAWQGQRARERKAEEPEAAQGPVDALQQAVSSTALSASASLFTCGLSAVSSAVHTSVVGGLS